MSAAAIQVGLFPPLENKVHIFELLCSLLILHTGIFQCLVYCKKSEEFFLSSKSNVPTHPYEAQSKTDLKHKQIESMKAFVTSD